LDSAQDRQKKRQKLDEHQLVCLLVAVDIDIQDIVGGAVASPPFQ
jgi:hypothetical protein